jgi:hypothetical protein
MKRVFSHAWNFYRNKFPIIILFSIPLFIAFLVSWLVPAPSYLAAGSVLIRTGSLPEMDLFSIAVTVISYLLSILIVSYTLTNLNLLIKEKRTRVKTKTESIKSIAKYTIKIFILLILLKVITLFLQLFTYGLEFQNLLYPVLMGILSVMFFFVPPAVVIDEKDTFYSLFTSIKLVIKKPVLVLLWIIFGLLAISVTELILFFLFGPVFGGYLTMLVNCLFILPFLIILNIHMYMERYPLAR